jgi:hypothetical protein
MRALLVVGALGLVAAVVFRILDKRTNADGAAKTARSAWIGIMVASAVYAIGLVGYNVAKATFIGAAHYVAAIALFVSILAVAVVNALRHHEPGLATGDRQPSRSQRTLGVLFTSDRYALVSVAMVITAVVGFPIALSGIFEDSVFWLEAALLILFAAFWIIQTAERWEDEHRCGDV